MQASARKKAITRNNGVVSGSVWQSRMKMDEVKGGIKVFNGENDGNGDEEGIRVYRRLRRNQSDNVAIERRKRRNWRPPDPVANCPIEKNPIQLRKARSELSNSPRISYGNREKDEDGGGEEEEEDEIEIEGEGKSFDDKEIDIALEKPNNVEEEKKIHQIQERTILPDIEKKPNHVIDLKKSEPDSVRPSPIEVEEEMLERVSETQNRMQNIVNLVMWRDISKSAFVFGFGTFFLLSSSYAKDLNFSIISAISYLGLVYLAVIFLFKSILRRGGALEFDEMDERYMIGEEEAIWVLRFLLPYINEVLLKLRALFSGDPATTMKLAVLLFVTARCGDSITIWTLIKLVFFGVFTIPKVFSSYSVQLARYGKFWLERFRDGWESCTHKKAAAAIIFTLIWNLSSTIARIWSVFMLVVAVKFYQQCVAEEWNGEEEEEEEEEVTVEEERQEDSKAALGQGNGLHHRRRGGPSTVIAKGREIKIKKGL